MLPNPEEARFEPRRINLSIVVDRRAVDRRSRAKDPRVFPYRNESIRSLVAIRGAFIQHTTPERPARISDVSSPKRTKIIVM